MVPLLVVFESPSYYASVFFGLQVGVLLAGFLCFAGAGGRWSLFSVVWLDIYLRNVEGVELRVETVMDDVVLVKGGS